MTGSTAAEQIEAASVGRGGGGERRRGDSGELLDHLPEIRGVGGEDGGGGPARGSCPLPRTLPHVGCCLVLVQCNSGGISVKGL